MECIQQGAGVEAQMRSDPDAAAASIRDLVDTYITTSVPIALASTSSDSLARLIALKPQACDFEDPRTRFPNVSAETMAQDMNGISNSASHRHEHHPTSTQYHVTPNPQYTMTPAAAAQHDRERVSRYPIATPPARLTGSAIRKFCPWRIPEYSSLMDEEGGIDSLDAGATSAVRKDVDGNFVVSFRSSDTLPSFFSSSEESDARRDRVFSLMGEFQMHYCTASCFTKGPTCRAHRPEDLCEATIVRISEDSETSAIRLQVFPKRNHCRANPFELLSMLVMCSNSDIRYCKNSYGATQYVTMYITKGEKVDFDAMKKALLLKMQRLQKENVSFSSVIRMVANTLIALRPVSIQEAVYSALGLPIAEWSRSFVRIVALRRRYAALKFYEGAAALSSIDATAASGAEAVFMKEQQAADGDAPEQSVLVTTERVVAYYESFIQKLIADEAALARSACEKEMEAAHAAACGSAADALMELGVAVDGAALECLAAVASIVEPVAAVTPSLRAQRVCTALGASALSSLHLVAAPPGTLVSEHLCDGGDIAAAVTTLREFELLADIANGGVDALHHDDAPSEITPCERLPSSAPSLFTFWTEYAVVNASSCVRPESSRPRIALRLPDGTAGYVRRRRRAAVVMVSPRLPYDPSDEDSCYQTLYLHKPFVREADLLAGCENACDALQIALLDGSFPTEDRTVLERRAAFKCAAAAGAPTDGGVHGDDDDGAVRDAESAEAVQSRTQDCVSHSADVLTDDGVGGRQHVAASVVQLETSLPADCVAVIPANARLGTPAYNVTARCLVASSDVVQKMRSWKKTVVSEGRAYQAHLETSTYGEVVPLSEAERGAARRSALAVRLDECYDQLTPLQRLAYLSFVSYLGPRPVRSGPCLMILSGVGGGGKSHVLSLMQQACYLHTTAAGCPRGPHITGALTNLAASNIRGCTLHHIFGIRYKGAAKTRAARIQFIRQRTGGIALFLDEFGVIPLDMMTEIEALCREAFGPTQPFGGLKVVLSGDPYQLDAIGAGGSFWKAFAAAPGTPSAAFAALFTDFVDVAVNMRLDVRKASHRVFADVLARARTGVISDDSVASRAAIRELRLYYAETPTFFNNMVVVASTHSGVARWAQWVRRKRIAAGHAEVIIWAGHFVEAGRLLTDDKRSRLAKQRIARVQTALKSAFSQTRAHEISRGASEEDATAAANAAAVRMSTDVERLNAIQDARALAVLRERVDGACVFKLSDTDSKTYNGIRSVEERLALYSYGNMEEIDVDPSRTNTSMTSMYTQDHVKHPPVLKLVIGQRVRLTDNVCPAFMLAKDAGGILVGFVYSDRASAGIANSRADKATAAASSQPLQVPIALVHFEGYSGPPFFPDDPALRYVVPIVPLAMNLNHPSHQVFTRIQLPLKQGDAGTAHSLQGMGFSHVLVDHWGGRSWKRGMAYVATSRVTAPEGLQTSGIPFTAESFAMDARTTEAFTSAYQRFRVLGERTRAFITEHYPNPDFARTLEPEEQLDADEQARYEAIQRRVAAVSTAALATTTTT